MTDPKEALAKAADAIEQYGHIKGDYGSTDRGFCVKGALLWAIRGDGDKWKPITNDPAWATCYLTALELLPCGRGGTAAWNDNPRTTKADVIRLLRECAA